MNKPVGTIQFSLDGQSRSPQRPGEIILQRAPARVRSRTCVRQGRPAARRQLPRLRGRDEGRAHPGALLLPRGATPGMKVDSASRAPWRRRPWCWLLLVRRCRRAPPRRTHAPNCCSGPIGEGAARRRAAPARALKANSPAPDLAPGDRGQPRRLHPVHALRARLPRHPGQRRDRPGDGGAHAKIVFDQDDPMGSSSCVACGECVQACPTGALMPARGAGCAKDRREIDSGARTAASAAS